MEYAVYAQTLRLMYFAKARRSKQVTHQVLAELLEPLYGFRPDVNAVVMIVFKSYVELLDERRFELPTKDDGILGMIRDPLRLRIGPEPTLKQAYNIMLEYVIGQMMIARVDWFDQYLTYAKQQEEVA